MHKDTVFGYLENDWWEMRRTVTGAKGRRSIAGAEEGEASPMWRNQSVASTEEGEASPMQRNRSVADSKNPKCRCSDHCESFVSAMVISDVTDSEKSKCRWCSNHCESFISRDGSGFIGDGYQRRHWFGEIEASSMLKSLRIVLSATAQVLSMTVIGDVIDSKKSKHCWCSDRCESFVSTTVQVLSATSLIRRNRSVADAQIVVNCSYRRRFKWVIDDGIGFIGNGYQRWIGFLRTVAWFLLGLGCVWFFWERRTEGLWENRK